MLVSIDDRDAESVIFDDRSGFFDAHDEGMSDVGYNSMEPMMVARRTTKGVVRAKVLAGAVLVGSATILASSVYFLLSSNERLQFQNQFRGDSHKVLESVGSSIDKTLGLLDSAAVSFLSSARDKNQTWPFVTLPDFAVKMTKILPITDAIVVNMLPIVTAEHRKKWEVYSLDNDDWVNEGMAVQEKWSGYHGPVVYNGQSNGVLHSDFEDLPYNLTRYYLPLWQNFPVIPNTTWSYNWDWMSFDFPDSYVNAIDKQAAVMAEAFMLPDPGDVVREAETQAWAEYYSDYIAPDEEPVEPMSDLIYPIVDGVIAQAKVNASDLPSDHTAVGVIVATLYWRDLIRNILPESSIGLDIVFLICAANFTYRINGPRVEYRGVGDHHEARYDDLKILSRREFANRNPLYSGFPIDAKYCDYSLHLYPSDALRASHTTRIPIISTAIVVFIFMFTSLFLLRYESRKSPTICHENSSSLFRNRIIIVPISCSRPPLSGFSEYREQA